MNIINEKYKIRELQHKADAAKSEADRAQGILLFTMRTIAEKLASEHGLDPNNEKIIAALVAAIE